MEMLPRVMPAMAPLERWVLEEEEEPGLGRGVVDGRGVGIGIPGVAT